jgi:hypothetical protein
MNRRTGSLVAVVLTIVTAPAGAQWLNYPTPGIPRLPNGKPNLSALAPRKPDGKPDLSGIWHGEQQIYVKYAENLGADFKPGEFPIQPWAEALYKQHMTDAGAGESPITQCLSLGLPIADNSALPFKIIQESGLVVILNEGLGLFRQVFLDGRMLPKDPNPTCMGYSVGRWDEDTLVVDSAGFNGKVWLDPTGHPTTDALHITERFRRRDFGHLDLELTVDDPKAFTRPWSVNLPKLLFPDTELLEFVCDENEKDLKHLVDK